MNSLKEIYFHVGLGKNASTYLQHRFFPKLKGIKYVHRSSYKNYKKILENAADNKYLFSREFDRQLEKETKEFSEYYPGAKTIIILRRHDSWIASQYRRFVKNGGGADFGEFLDIYKDEGLWKIKDLTFFDKIKYLENHFENKPLVLFHEELKQNPIAFMNKLADFMDVDFNKDKINLKPFHKSYSLKQLKYMKKWGEKYLGSRRESFKNSFHKWLYEISRLHYCHFLLFLAKFSPEDKVKDEILIPEDYKKMIKDYFETDWIKCKAYAENNNP